MKQIITIILMAIATIGFSQSTDTLDIQPEGTFVNVRSTEVKGMITFWESSIVVSDGKKVLKTVELEEVEPENFGANLVKITAVLNEIEAAGYELVSSNSGGSSQGFLHITNYIFRKKR